MRYRGVAYYPEAWPVERWDRDIRLMREAGFNMVRMGEFAWARLEPRDGEFRLEWWLDVIDRMRRTGMSVMLCTPTAAPPAWLTRAAPEVLWVDETGRRKAHGGRRQYCPRSPRYREFVARIVRRLAEAVRANPAVFAWQIDNEVALDGVGAFCFCDECTRAFRDWLRRRYGDIGSLNVAWGNAFWSGDFSGWQEIGPPYQRLSWMLDYARFQSATYAEFVAAQAAILRAVNPAWRITTNQWTGLTATLDTAEMFAPLDVATLDAYQEYYAPREFYAATFDLYRNLKGAPRAFWQGETNAWNPSATQRDGLAALRPWAWLSFAKGAEAYCYFRWRQSPMGEEDHPAVLDWSGETGRPYHQVQAVMKEMESLEAELRDLPLPEAQAAILFDFGSAYCDLLRLKSTDWRAGCREHVVEADATLSRMGVAADILPVSASLDLSRYRLLVLSQVEMVSAELAAAIKRFVSGGGVVLAQPRLAMLDANGKYLLTPMPGGLTGLFGVTVRERCAPMERYRRSHAFSPAPDRAPVDIDVELNLNAGPRSAHGRHYMEMLEPAADAQTLARYRGSLYAETPAMTGRKHGSGLALYQGCWLDESATRDVFAYAAHCAGLAVCNDLPPNVDCLRRGRLRFYLNHTGQPVDVALRAPGESLAGRIAGGVARLDAYGVCIVREEK